ncbi:MAG: ATP-binding protein [Bacteroidales bacterium]|nr:ATP-binding protein [Bacteroidales bacterium]
MIDKRILEVVLWDQKEELEVKREQNLCRREEESLIDLHSSQAQVVIGVRRCGKSTLCFQALEHAGVNYAYADFDDERLHQLDAMQLNDVLEVLYKIYGDFKYLFLDEIQNVEGWHLFVNRMLRIGMHVIATGSNSKLLGGELATHLTGRSKEINLYPFSFSEFCALKGIDTKSKSTKAEAFRRTGFDLYLKDGGFPEMMTISDTRSYVNDIVKNIVFRDLEQRFKIRYKAAFEQLVQHLLNISPTIINAKNLANTFHFKSDHTANNYVSYLKQAYLLIGVKKYSVKSKLRIVQEKTYAVDVTLMNQRENAFSGENFGLRLETIVLIQLLRKSKIHGWDVYYLNERAGECDFLVCNGRQVVQAVQVSYDISTPKTRTREINGLLLAAKTTGCKDLLLLTDHEYGQEEINGHNISIRPVYDWALE